MKKKNKGNSSYWDSPDDPKYQFNMGFETLRRMNWLLWEINLAFNRNDFIQARSLCDSFADELSPFFSDLNEYENEMIELNKIVAEVDTYQKKYLLSNNGNSDEYSNNLYMLKLASALRKYQRKLRMYAHELNFLMKEKEEDYGL